VTRRSLTLALTILAGGCSGFSGGGSPEPGAPGAGDDEAERLYQEGVSWARKAETAPLPTPDPAAPQIVPEFKPEELRAVESFEKAIAARPEHAGAHMGLADLLAPHALQRIERERLARERQAEEAAARGRSRRGRSPPPTPPPTVAPMSLVDASPERVIREYQAAVLGDPGRAPVDRLVTFAVAAGRFDIAEAGYQELLRRVKESGEPHTLYGDFLVTHKHDQDGAIDQYRQALIWNPKDEPTRAKLAEIYLARAAEYYRTQEFMRAADELREAQKYVTDRNSDLGRRVQAYLAKMREIRR
jgi:tetratricopeptide (TPR) repeat protein